MDGIGPGIVIGMVVHVGGAADAVARLDVEPDAVAAPEHHRGRPDLDLHLHDLAGREIDGDGGTGDKGATAPGRARDARPAATPSPPAPAYPADRSPAPPCRRHRCCGG